MYIIVVCQYLLHTYYVTVYAVEITEHPENVSAFVGDSVLIRCGSPFAPYWIINDEVFPPNELPPHYINGKQGLKIPYVEEFMNNTKFVCALSTQVISRAGYLTVLTIIIQTKGIFD